MAEMATINEVLPNEILEKVFRMLPRRDLKRAVLVCRRWRDVGESPILWAWVAPHCRKELVALDPTGLSLFRDATCN